MSRLSLRATIISTSIPADLEAEVQRFIEERVPDGIVEVRRTITSETERVPPAS